MPGIFILGFIVFVVVAIFAGIHAHRQKKEREAALTQLASELGWQYDPAADSSHADRFHQFNIFATGQSRYAYNTMRGAINFEGESWYAQMGDYHYTTTSGSGKNRRTTSHHFSYLLVETPYAVAPDLRIRREQIFDRMASFVGFDDIDFESAEFSDRFHVKSTNKRFAYDVIHPRMMEFLLDKTPPTIHFEAGCCCIHADGKCWSHTDFRDHIKWVHEFLSLWPKHITSTLQS